MPMMRRNLRKDSAPETDRRRLRVLLTGLVLLGMLGTGQAGEVPSGAAGGGTAPSVSVLDPQSVLQSPTPASLPSTDAAALRPGQPTVPFFFEIQTGQDASPVLARALGPGYSVLLTHRDVVISTGHAARHGQEETRRDPAVPGARSPAGDVLRLTTVGGAQQATLVPESPLPSVTHYLGPDGQPMSASAPHYARVRLQDVYPGIDQVTYGHAGRLEYDWIVRPGADPSVIVQRLEGATSLAMQPNGDLRAALAASVVTVKRPVAYQVIEGERRAVEAAFVLNADNEVRFQIGAYDTTRALVIDPVVEYATYLTSPPFSEQRGMRVGPDGAIYIVYSGDLAYLGTQTVDNPYPSYFTYNDTVVVKLHPAGAVVDYVTVFKGVDFDASGSDFGPDHRLYFLASIVDGTLPPQGAPTYTQTPVLGLLAEDGANFTPLRHFTEYRRIAPGSGFSVTVDGASRLRVGVNGDFYLTFRVYSGAFNSIVTPVTTLVGSPEQWSTAFRGCALQRLSAAGALTQYTVVIDRCLAIGLDIDDVGNAIVADIFLVADVVGNPLPGLFVNGQYVFPPPGTSPATPGGTVVAPNRLHRINTDGSLAFSKPVTGRPTLSSTGIYHARANAMALDAAGNIFTAGTALSKFDPAGNLLASQEVVRLTDSEVLDLVSRGVPDLVWPIDPEVFYGFWSGAALVVDSANRPIVVGATGFRVGNSDAPASGYVARLSPDLRTIEWASTITTALHPMPFGITRLTDVGRDQRGDLYVLGYGVGSDLEQRHPLPGTLPADNTLGISFLIKLSDDADIPHLARVIE